MFLSLTIICVVAGAILAGVNMYTTGPIAATKAAALEAAIKAVTPAFDNKPTEDAYMAVTTDGDSLKIYPAMKDAERVQWRDQSDCRLRCRGQAAKLLRTATCRNSGSGRQDAGMVPRRQEPAERIGTQLG